jgi:tetratricopeptide (TPR) repeat protein
VHSYKGTKNILYKDIAFVHALGLRRDLAFREGRLKEARKLEDEYSKYATFTSPVKNEEMTKNQLRLQEMEIVFGQTYVLKRTCDFTDYLTETYLPDDDPIRIKTTINRTLADCIDQKYLLAKDTLRQLHEKQSPAFHDNPSLEGKYNLAMGWASFGESSSGESASLRQALDYANQSIILLQKDYPNRMDYAQALRLSGLVLSQMNDPQAIERLKIALRIVQDELNPKHPYLAKFYRDYADALLKCRAGSSSEAYEHAHRAYVLAKQLYMEIPIRPDEQQVRQERLERYRTTLNGARTATSIVSPAAKYSKLEI